MVSHVDERKRSKEALCAVATMLVSKHPVFLAFPSSSRLSLLFLFSLTFRRMWFLMTISVGGKGASLEELMAGATCDGEQETLKLDPIAYSSRKIRGIKNAKFSLFPKINVT